MIVSNMKSGADNRPRLSVPLGSIDLEFPFETSDAGSFINALAKSVPACSFERIFCAGPNTYILSDIELEVPDDTGSLRCKVVTVKLCGTLLPHAVLGKQSSDPLNTVLGSLKGFIEGIAVNLATEAQHVDDAGDAPVAMHFESVSPGQILQNILACPLVSR